MDMRKIQLNLAASDKTAAKKKLYDRTVSVGNQSGIDVEIMVAAESSFDGKRWNVGDDRVCITLADLGEFDDESGGWEVNQDCMDAVDGMAWLYLTPQQARSLARKLLTYASKCRKADEVDTSDPKLIEALSNSERQMRAIWAEEEKENLDGVPLMPPILEKAWK